MPRTMSLSDRYHAVLTAAEEERRRFNEACSKGARPTIQTAFGPYTVTAVSGDWWYSTTAGRSFCGCNDSQWANLMDQVHLERHPLFAVHTARPAFAR